MKFSVIVPTYNRLETLKKCLEALLSQDYPSGDFKVIVVDDGSHDGTREYLSSVSDSRLNFYLKDHAGPARTRNFGVSKSQGAYLAFTDDDCLVPTNWLGELEKGFNKWPRAAAVGGYLEAPDPVLKNNLLAKLEFYETHSVYHASGEEYLGGFESPSGGTNNISYRREIFEQLRGFDENIPVPAAEDADLKLRAVQTGYKIGYLPLKVTHLDPYTFGSFIKRSIRSGMGSAYFEQKNFNKGDSAIGLLVTSFKALGKLFLSLFSLKFLLATRYLKEILMIYGRYNFLFRER